jgi:hypothetical protein
MDEQPQQSGSETKPLTNWAKPPTLMELKQDLESAKPIHDAQVTKISGWLDNLNVTGAAKVVAPKGNSSIVPKTIRKQAEWRYAALSEPFLSTDSLFNVRPVTWEDKKAAEQNELLLNHQFNLSIDRTKFIDEYVRTAVDEGTVIVRVGWEFEEEEYKEMVPVVQFRVNPELGPLHEQLHLMMQDSPSQYATDVPEELKQAHAMTMEQGQPIEAVVVGQREETKTRTLKNRPTVEICDYKNVVLDPTCMGDISKASFLGYSFESSLSALEKDGRYKNLDKINLEAASILGQPDFSSSVKEGSFNFTDKARKKITVQEYWGYRDIDGDGLVKPIMASWVGDVCIRMEDNPFPDKQIPFVIEQYLPVRKSNYGEPDGALLEDNQKVIGAVTRGMIDLMGKSANGQTGMRKDMLDVTNRRKFDRGLDYEFNQSVDPRVGVHMHTYPEIPRSAEFMVSMQNREAESLTGVKSFSDGVSGKSLGDVAAGVRGALDAASKRELGILRRLSNGVINIGRKFTSMNAEFLSDEEVVRVTNEEFVKVRKDDLAGNFDLRLSISTAEEDNNKAEQLAFMLQTMGNNMDPSLAQIVLSDIAKLRKMPDLANKIENFKPQPNPMAEKKAQLEIALLEAQIANEQAKAMELQSQAHLNQARAGTEGAKQGHLKSDTDLKNLNFVEQESGVQQERDMQMVGEQANSQARLAEVTHSFKREELQNDLLKEYLKNNLRKT